MVKQNGRLLEIDALKFIALLLILYAHSEEYILKLPFFEWYRIGGMYTGLGLFMFLSGYGLQYSALKKVKTGQFNALEFLKRRLIRIYPLYLVALFTFVALFHFLKIYHYNWEFLPLPQTILVHSLSLQSLLYPFTTQIPTLWFIGALIPLYFLFALTAQFKTRKFFLLNLVILLVVTVVHFLVNVIDTRLIFFHPIFLLGCICARKQFFSLNLLNRSRTLLWGSALLTFASYYVFKRYGLLRIAPEPVTTVREIVSYGVVSVYTLASIALMLVLVSKASWLLNKVRSQLIYVSNLLYPAYLFHRCIYAVAYYFLLGELKVSNEVGTLLFPGVTLLLLGVSDLMNRLEVTFINRFEGMSSTARDREIVVKPEVLTGKTRQ